MTGLSSCISDESDNCRFNDLFGEEILDFFAFFSVLCGVWVSDLNLLPAGVDLTGDIIEDLLAGVKGDIDRDDNGEEIGLLDFLVSF